MKRFALYTLCAPMDLLGLLIACVFAGPVVAARMARSLATGQDVAVAFWPSWLERRWPYSTTFGHVIMMTRGHGYDVLRHELIHARQAEAACVAYWLLTLVAWSPTMALLSPFAWLAVYGASCVAAWLAGRPAYLGSVFEEHARSEAE